MKMNRIAYMVLRRFYKVPWMMKELITAGNQKKYSAIERYNKVRGVVKMINNYSHVNIHCTGLENLPKENGFIITPNHQGLYDPLLVVDTCELPLSVVVKDSIANVILVKQVVKAVDGMPINREDPREGMKVIMEMTSQIKKGRNYLIFPEGTRSKNGNITGTFKGGTFKSAVKAKAPIVPVALIDSYKPFDIKDTGEVDVQIHYLKPISYEEYKDMKTVEIAAKVKEIIDEKIKEELGKISKL